MHTNNTKRQAHVVNIHGLRLREREICTITRANTRGLNMMLMTEDGSLTCTRPAQGKLRVVLLCLKPWTAIPGVTGTSCAQPHPVNDPPAFCQPRITSGTPCDAHFTGSPLPYTDKSPLPEYILRRFGTGPHTSLVFNFGFQPSGEASGSLTACSRSGRIAELDFVYRWGDAACPPPQATCPDPVPLVTGASFEVTGASSAGARFLVLDTETYMSSSRCAESIVIAALEC